MKKVLFFALLVSVISYQLSVADVWIEDGGYDLPYYTMNVVSHNLSPDSEIYLGFFCYNDRIDFSDSSEFYLESLSWDVTVEQVWPLLDHDAMYRVQKEFLSTEDLCSINIQGGLYGVVVYELKANGNWYTRGSVISALDSFLHVKTEGPYTIGPGQTVSLNAAGYYISCEYYGWNPGYDPLSEDPVGYETWWLGEPYEGVGGGEYIPSTVSYDYLTNQLGLSPGTYTITAEMEYPIDEGEMLIPGYDRTTITIVPEPCTVLLLG